MEPKKDAPSMSTNANKKRKFFKKLRIKVQRSQNKKKPSGRIGYLLLYFGAVSLISSIIFISSILAYIGLGLALWGGLFLFIKPTKYVKLNVLNSTALSSVITIDKILTELDFKGQGIHLPPRRLTKLKEVVVILPQSKQTPMPKAEEIDGRVFMNPVEMCLTPLGQGLLNLYEKELGTDLSIADMDYLKNHLSTLLIENLEILEDFEISEQDDKVYVKMKGSVLEDLYNYLKSNTSTYYSLGCPLCSSIACAIAKATDKAVVIDKEEHSTDGKKIETWYRLVES